MLPALAIIGIGSGRKFRVPLPFFLLWPLFLAGALVMAALGGSRFRAGRQGFFARFRTCLAVFYHLSGLNIDVRSRDGTSFYLRLI